MFELVGCEHLGKLKFKDESTNILEKKVYFEVDKLNGNTLNDIKMQQRDENPSGETIFEIGKKVCSLFESASYGIKTFSFLYVVPSPL